MAAPATPWTPQASPTELDLVDAAVATLRLRHPEWQPREGNTEIMLLEAMAVIAGQTGYAVEQVPAAVLGRLLMLYGVDRLGGVPAKGQIHVAGSTSMAADAVLPAGTVLRIRRGDGTSFDLTTDGDLSVPASSSEGWVTVTCTAADESVNGTPVGTGVELVDGQTWVETITLSQGLVGGIDEETDDAWFNRGAANLRRRRSAFVLPVQFADAALDTIGVVRASVINLWDGASSTAGQDLGHVTIIGTGVDGAALDAPVKTAMVQDLTGQAIAGVTVHTVDATYRAGTLTWSVIRTSDGDGTAITAAVHAAVAAYLSPETWPFGQDPNNFRLATILGGIDGVAVVTACTWTFTDAAPNPTGLQLIGAVTYADETVTAP